MGKESTKSVTPESSAFQIRGYDHIKVALKNVEGFEKSLDAFGFQKLTQEVPFHFDKPTSVWGSGEAFFCLYSSDHRLAKPHYEKHGDWIFDLSYLVEAPDPHFYSVFDGISGMKHTLVGLRTFKKVPAPRGVLRFDHNTINVDRGELDVYVDKYLKAFGFEKGQFFNIKGKQTGLTSWVTRSKDFSVQMPFNEASDDKSQIQEYIRIHHGGGVQHLALYTENIIQTIEEVRKKTDIKFLELPDTYYEVIEKKVKTTESLSELKRLRIQADQDERGYLLQIFTQYLFGGFFFELIQRAGNQGFGEGNFTALFEAMELDQKRRGVL